MGRIAASVFGTIIAAMERLDRHFDRVGRKQTLNSAVIWVVSSSILIAFGVVMIIKYWADGEVLGYSLV